MRATVTPMGATPPLRGIIGLNHPSSSCQGNPRSALSDRQEVALQCRPLLEGNVLAVRALWISEMVALPVFCEDGLCCVSCSRCEALGRNVRHHQHSSVDCSPSSARPCHLLASRRLSWCMSSGTLVWGSRSFCHACVCGVGCDAV
jgi:hypothetical protein